MRISPVMNLNFAKKYSASEVKKAQMELEDAKSAYRALEDRTFLSVAGGMDAWFRAKDYGFQYADATPEGDRFKKAWEEFSKAHTHPLKEGEAEAKAAWLEARKAYYSQASIGRINYFVMNEGDNQIRQEVLQKMAETEEGQKIINNYTVAQDKYINVISGK